MQETKTYDEQELKEMLTKLANHLDQCLVKFAFQCKLNGLGNTWIYHQMKFEIEKQAEEIQPLLQQWLDARWGEYKLF